MQGITKETKMCDNSKCAVDGIAIDNDDKAPEHSKKSLWIYPFIAVMGFILPIAVDYIGQLVIRGRVVDNYLIEIDILRFILFGELLPVIASLLSVLILCKSRAVFRFMPIVISYSFMVFMHLLCYHWTHTGYKDGLNTGIMLYFVLPIALPIIILALTAICLIGNMICDLLKRSRNKTSKKEIAEQ